MRITHIALTLDNDTIYDPPENDLFIRQRGLQSRTLHILFEDKDAFDRFRNVINEMKWGNENEHRKKDQKEG